MRISIGILSLITTLCAVTGMSMPAQALKLNFTYDTEVTMEEKVAAELAGSIWEQYLTDNATINIHLKKGNSSKLPSGVLAGAIPAFMNNVNYSSFYNALKSDRTTDNNIFTYTNDELAVENLPIPLLFSSLTAEMEGFKDKSFSNINLTRANAKALNLLDTNNTDLDGVIVFNDLINTGFGWQNDYLSSGVGINKFDFTSVLIHEIGHVLGFVSGIDAVNDNNYNNEVERNKYITSFDLFRKSSLTTDHEINMTYGGTGNSTPFFSINGGDTALANLSTGENEDLKSSFFFTNYQPDGYQGSHWKRSNNGTALGIMDPSLPSNTRRGLTNLDLQALDVIGYNRASSNFNILSSAQLSTLQNQAQTIANTKGNSTPVSNINKMFKQSRWGGTTTTTTLNQGQDLTEFLAQEGLFQVNNGTMWDSYDEEPQQVPEPSAILGLLSLGLFGLRLGKKKIHSETIN
ncbi:MULTISPECIES: NF038122 family metalloprotease [Calothrix]|uniref:PEP-CTERM sorting domain-containing protein n=2 Tax=Calothrix TaxID=1186 RepID=A0ABR8AFY5_9CYAN|nr:MULTISPECIES: NF038122 family metalloprotease [Calothrix]MBD2198100.1 PEP-CTERM sorting domain-containing protein [Calothrix parietina FACHB-288]MBD2226477.1 PEP-CTERM sorting domain-containing protein [Calothrix anomala FACHB-343]